jgi:hypothetical protein
MLISAADEGSRLWTRDRTRGMDRRTRGYRHWAARRAGFAASLGRQPTADESELLDALADVAIERDLLRARRHAGERIDPATVHALTGELRRLRRALGLEDGNGAADSTPHLADILERT